VTFPPLPPAPSTSSLVLFSPAQWQWLTMAVGAIHVGQQALFEALGPLVFALEHTMAAIDDLKAQNEQIKTAIVTLGEEISEQIQQLVAAQGNDAEVAAVAADLQATNTKLQEFVSSLQADDVVPPAP
jgi:predicted KAP-like P-loop ATPase